MADVEMNDAHSTAKRADTSANGKKKFEVKKVCKKVNTNDVKDLIGVNCSSDLSIVECRCPLGVGYRGR